MTSVPSLVRGVEGVDLGEVEDTRLPTSLALHQMGGEGELMCGWLTKSPPTLDSKKPIFNPKWRRRWFVLREGGVPSQYILSYYADNNTKKLKGSIDLDQCYQVDSGLTYKSGKTSLSNLFNIKTQKRIYYLSADSLEEMNAWVQSLCQACGLRAYQTDEGEEKDVDALTQHLDLQSTLGRKGSSLSEGEGGSAVGSLASTPRGGTTNQTHISGPYIPLADCFTGGGIPSTLRKEGDAKPDPSRSGHRTPFSSVLSSGDISLTCGEDSVFLPSSPPGNLPRNCSFEDSTPQGLLAAPSRPPKPISLRGTSHPSKSCGDNYENLYSTQNTNINSSSQRSTLSPLSGSVSTPQMIDEGHPSPPSHPPPPAPQPSTAGAIGPPQVDRRLKPGRGSISGSMTSGTATGGRKQSSQFDTHRSVHSVHSSHVNTLDNRLVGRTSSLESVDSRRNSAGEETIYYYMPSLQPNNAGDGKWDPIMIPAQDMISHSINYLDLDLPTAEARPPDNRENRVESESPATVYKTVDFVKTEAFNKTKQNVEDERYKKNAS